MKTCLIVCTVILIACFGCNRNSAYTDSMLMFYHYNCDGHEYYSIISSSSECVDSLIKKYNNNYNYSFNYDYLNSHEDILIISPATYGHLKKYINQLKIKTLKESDIHSPCPYMFNVELLEVQGKESSLYSFNSTITLLDDVISYVNSENFQEKSQLSDFFIKLKGESLKLTHKM